MRVVIHGLSDRCIRTVFMGIVVLRMLMKVEVKSSTLPSVEADLKTLFVLSWFNLIVSSTSTKFPGFISRSYFFMAAGNLGRILGSISKHWWSKFPKGGRCVTSLYIVLMFVRIWYKTLSPRVGAWTHLKLKRLHTGLKFILLKSPQTIIPAAGRERRISSCQSSVR